MTLNECRRAYDAALALCRAFGWQDWQLEKGLSPLDSQMNFGGSGKWGRMEREAVELALDLREQLHSLELNAVHLLEARQ